jgi:hypothetical protein
VFASSPLPADGKEAHIKDTKVEDFVRKRKQSHGKPSRTNKHVPNLLIGMYSTRTTPAFNAVHGYGRRPFSTPSV